MISLRESMAADYKKIVDWNKGKDEKYLFQWSGNRIYHFPITNEQIEKHSKEEKILMIEKDGETIGSIEIANIDQEKKSAFICRYIIRESMQNKGYGEKALRAVCDMIMKQMEMEIVRLHVYAYNVGAMRCYEKVGFLVEEYYTLEEAEYNFYTMQLTKKRFMEVRQ